MTILVAKLTWTLSDVICKSCVGCELQPAAGSIYDSDNARQLFVSWDGLWNAEAINENPEGKQYKNLTAEWYDAAVLVVTLALSQLETQGVALSGSYWLLNFYCSAIFFLAASGTYSGH